MTSKTIAILALVGIILLLTTTSSNSPEVIYWNGDKRLEWTDFMGQPRFDYKDISALTSSGIVHYKGCKDGQIIYKVRAYFEKKESWVKIVARTKHHLEHEQLHFDITELYARKLRKALSEKEYKCGQEEEFEAFVGHFLQDWELSQQKYDMLTRHSMDKAAQKEWVYKIAMELSLLENYAEQEEE